LIGLTLNFSFTKTFSQTRNKIEVGESTFQLISVEEGIKYKSVESTYKVFYMVESGKSDNYLARYKTSTTENRSEETPDRTIEVTISPLSQLNFIKYKIKQDCDELDLLNGYYKTIKYGCCLQSTEVRLYDYSNNLIIEGSERIFQGNIPNNSKNDFYFSYKSPTDTLSLGQINFWFNENDRYQIILKTKRSTEHDGLEVCPILYPKIEMNLNVKDRFDNEEIYTFWSMEEIKSTSDINFSFTLAFDCDSTILPITIPITNGKPFGKNVENQIYNVEYK